MLSQLLARGIVAVVLFRLFRASTALMMVSNAPHNMGAPGRYTGVSGPVNQEKSKLFINSGPNDKAGNHRNDNTPARDINKKRNKNESKGGLLCGQGKKFDEGITTPLD